MILAIGWMLWYVAVIFIWGFIITVASYWLEAIEFSLGKVNQFYSMLIRLFLVCVIGILLSGVILYVTALGIQLATREATQPRSINHTRSARSK